MGRCSAIRNPLYKRFGGFGGNQPIEFKGTPTFSDPNLLPSTPIVPHPPGELFHCIKNQVSSRFKWRYFERASDLVYRMVVIPLFFRKMPQHRGYSFYKGPISNTSIPFLDFFGGFISEELFDCFLYNGIWMNLVCDGFHSIKVHLRIRNCLCEKWRFSNGFAT